MTPTPGNWAYDTGQTDVRSPSGRALALLISVAPAFQLPTQRERAETHANGYLMAAAPQLRDELINLSHAVRAYFLARESGADMPPDEAIAAEMQALDQMDVMLRRAERALETIFPPEPSSEVTS